MKYRRRAFDAMHQYRRWIDPRIRTLRVADVVAYLRRRGWTEVPPDRLSCRVFRAPAEVRDEDAVYEFVPESEGQDDYPLRMFELLSGIAEMENRQASAVIDDIVRTGALTEPNGAVQGASASPESLAK